MLQGFGPALSATVVRDRLIGVFFGLIVFGIVEYFLWPVRARDALRARLAEMVRLLADLARSGTRSAVPTAIDADVDSWRRRISQKVEEIQTHIESSKFESGDLEITQIQKLTGDAQTIFILILSLARQSREMAQSDVVWTTANELDNAIATTLETLAARAAGGSEPPLRRLDDPLNTFERTVAGMSALDQQTAAHITARLALYRTLVDAIKKMSLEPMTGVQDGYEARVLAAE